ncbi:hypothetical protein BBF96_10110 [Anoxybacter fermentans]|uniref:Metalloprotease TldD/E C-terminal domain-containing protein n=1 Tax=Anoxybacter fermentans TaxID=1323375 RepID=A0A3Q9HQT8_9FIRM|nr:metallopeptidase TldD-related protein [Anoxybacter fermentans]AZR73705.1 hypothetical protein BBF96_10110 [Anoxybacter fermentans]
MEEIIYQLIDYADVDKNLEMEIYLENCSLLMVAKNNKRNNDFNHSLMKEQGLSYSIYGENKFFNIFTNNLRLDNIYYLLKGKRGIDKNTFITLPPIENEIEVNYVRHQIEEILNTCLKLSFKINYVDITGQFKAKNVIIADHRGYKCFKKIHEYYYQVTFIYNERVSRTFILRVDPEGNLEKNWRSKLEKEIKNTEELLIAEQVVPGEYPMVIGNGEGGLLIHEACGHSLEGTNFVVGSYLKEKMNQKVAVEEVTLIDDPTIPDLGGTYYYDDQGTVAKKTVLIENGLLRSVLLDRRSALLMNSSSTGNGRRESYKKLVTSRMSNTYLKPGIYEPEEIIASVKDGIFATTFGGGNVNPLTGDFTFVIKHGYFIKNGKLIKPIKNVTVVGNGYEFLNNIEMIGNDLVFSNYFCFTPNGILPVGVGQPTLKISKMKVVG